MSIYEYKKNIPFTIEVPKELYETVEEYQKRFKPHISIDMVMTESIIDETRNWFIAQDIGNT